MDIVVAQSELHIALKQVARVVTKKPAHNDLAFVRISPTSSEGVRIQGFNVASVAEVTVTLNMSSLNNFSGEDRIYVNLFNLIDAISIIDKDQPVVLKVRATGEDMLMSIGDNHGVYSHISCQSSSESLDDINLFPLNDKSKKTFHIHSRALSQALSSTSFAASRDFTKGVIAGVNLKVNGNKTSVVATNGHIMTLIHLEDVVDSEESEIDITMPFGVSQDIGKLLKGKNVSPMAVVNTSENCFEIEFTVGHITYNFKSIQVPGDYPNYLQLFPSGYRFTSTVGMDELVPALKAASKVADPHNNVVKLSFSDGSLEVSASRNKDEGEGQVKFSRKIAASSTEDFDIAFNVSYLLDGFKVMPNSGKEVILQANAPTTPATFLPGREAEGTNFTYLVMPVQIRS